ncbi:hypothetical protein M758_6G140700 [Ceratodon purpureus]|nr:hypothetical protein M758_6G140700 [Ceratodon purpureus]
MWTHDASCMEQTAHIFNEIQEKLLTLAPPNADVTGDSDIKHGKVCTGAERELTKENIQEIFSLPCRSVSEFSDELQAIRCLSATSDVRSGLAVRSCSKTCSKTCSLRVCLIRVASVMVKVVLTRAFRMVTL